MIHPTAVVEGGVIMGRDVQVGPFAYIAEGAMIGDACVLGPHVTVLGSATLGNGCRVHAGAVIGDAPQDLAFKPDTRSYVRIGAGCVIREGVTIHRGTKPETLTEVGDGCFLMANSHLAHNVRLGRNVILANGALLAGYVDVGERAFISGNTVVHQFVRIGRLAMLGGAAGFSKDVPPFCMTRSGWLNRVVGLNVVGLQRSGMPPEVRLQMKQAFAMLYRSGLNVAQAVERMKTAFPDGPARELWEFVEASKRGICGTGRAADESEL